MQLEVTTAIEEGRRALEAADWARARDAFAGGLAGEVPEALEGYGLAIWFLGALEDAIEMRQRACLAYAARGDCDRAARLAVWVSHQYLISGRASLANGWLARAERELEGHGACAGAGWVAAERARRGTVEEALADARAALELGRAHGDGDLEVFALTALGQAEIAAGRFDHGMRALEEAMAAATAGRVSNPHTLGEAYCNMIAASANAGDWERASEWCELVDRHARNRSIVPLHGACRTVHAEVLTASGRWAEAERALAEALEAARKHYPTSGAQTLAALALLRIRQGRHAEAEELLVGRAEDPTTLLALAELRLADGAPTVAVALLERALASTGGDILLGARLLGPLVDARLAAGDAAGARGATDQLTGLAAESGRAIIAARAHLAAARCEHAEGDDVAAHEQARLALDAFSRLGMPHDAAEARLELARTLVDGNPGLAREEARAAQIAFRELGARRSQEAAGSLARELEGHRGLSRRADGDLTEREREVLALLVRGLTNAQIGRALFITEKTAGHHVSSILGKLGVRNRAEAAAHAARLAPSPGE